MVRWTTKPSPGSWLSYPNLAGAVVLTEGGGAPTETLTNAQGVLSGGTTPTWDRPEPTDLNPTLLFTQGASLNSYADFGARGAFLNLGKNTPMTLIARIFWTGGRGGIAERTGSAIGWAWGISSASTLMFLKKQSTETQGRSDTIAGGAVPSNTWITAAVTYEGDVASNGGSIRNYVNGIVGTGGDVRGGTGTNQDDSAGSFYLGNSTIDMPGVGNPMMSGSFGGRIAWLIGFHRVLSTDELLAFNYLRNVPSLLWRRFTAPRRARYTPAPPPEDGFTIDGTPIDILQRWSISEQLNERGTMRFGVKSMDASYRPGLREAIDFRQFSIHFFAGHIHHTDEGALARVPYGVVPIETQCGATDFNALLDRRELSITLAAGTLKSQMEQIEPYLTPYGTVIAPAQVDGPTMPELTFAQGSLKALIDKLSLASEYASNINYDNEWSMFAPGTEAAPFDIEDDDGRVIGDVTVSPTSVAYANRIIVRAGTGTQDVSDPVGTGDGIEDTFELNYNVAALYGYVTNDVTNETLRVVGDPDSATWEYNPATNSITRLSGAPANGNAITIPYNAQFPFDVVAEDVPAQDGGANLFERTIIEDKVFDVVTAQALADGYLVRSLVQPREIRYRTRLHGLHPGMQQQIQVTGRNVDGPCLITNVEISPEGSALINYDVTAVEGLVIVPSVQDGWRTLAGRVA